MKFFYTTVLLSLISVQSMASEYICRSEWSGAQASLIMTENVPLAGVQWSEKHAASSNGVFLGVEEAPYSAFVGYSIYMLTDFYQVEDSDFRLAIEPTKGNHTFNVYTYFNNDDFNEEEMRYTCYRK